MWKMRQGRDVGQGSDPGTRWVLPGFTVVGIGMLYEVYVSSHLPIYLGRQHG